MKKKLIGIILFIVLLVLGFVVFKFINKEDVGNDTEVVEKKESYTFIDKGITCKKTSMYVNDDGKYKEIGTVEENISLKFVELVDDFLLIDGNEYEYYVKINDVNACNEDCLEEVDSRYKSYILFNENIVTGDVTSFYDEYDNLLYTINESYNLPIIIKDDDRYGVEFNNRLLYIKKDNVKDINNSNNTDKSNASGVGVLNYHFFYDEENDSEKLECNQIICISKSEFQEHLDYLKNNNILTITTNELELYIDGKINLPKSVLITIDDGYMMNNGIELLEKNQMYATVFLITSWFKEVNFKDAYKYIEFNSHGEDLHDVGVCPGGQGGAIKCLDRDKLLEDLDLSRNKLGGATSFAYPFYEYNNYSISVLKEAGITMAFAGEGTTSDSLVHVGSNKYTLPRFVIVTYTGINDIANYLVQIK